MSATTIIINDETPRRQYTAAGGQVNFDFPFPFFSPSDLKVYKTPVGQEASDDADSLTLDSDYTVTGAGTQAGGQITLSVGAGANDIITIDRVVAVARTADYQISGDFLAETLNEEQDLTIMMIQQLRSEIDRVVRRQATSTSEADLILPDPQARFVLGWNSAGDGLVNYQEIGDYRGEDTTVTTLSYTARAIVKDSTNGNVYLCLQNAVAGTLLTNTAFWALLVDNASATASAATATTQAGIATTAANTATTQAGIATTGAETATTQAGIATTGANTATTQAGIATTQANRAESEADRAETNANSVDTDLLVSKDSQTGAALLPTGTTAQRPVAPVEGMFRSNSEANVLEWYNGSSWIDLGNAFTARFVWDSLTATPAQSIDSPMPLAVKQNIYDQMKGCVVNTDGSVNYYLNPVNWSQKADGTASALTGADGNVMVEIPKFYYRTNRVGSQYTWEISDLPVSGFDVHPAFVKDGVEVSHRYYAAYDACLWDDSASAYVSGLNLDDMTANIALANDRLASVKGIYPLVGVTRAECRTLAANNGAGWRQLDFTLFSAVQILYLIENQNFFSQAILGDGNTNGSYLASSSNQNQSPHTVAGAGDAIANGSTDAVSGVGVDAKPGTSFIKYRGIENFYGNCWNWADGINVNIGSAGTVYITNNAAHFADDTSANMELVTSSYPTATSFVTDLLPTEAFFLAANASGGSSTTYITDQQFKTTTTNRVVRVGGFANVGADAGAFCVNAIAASSLANRLLGARLAR